MLSQRRYSSVKSRIERNGRDKEKINASKNAHHKKERTHARLFADMGANFIFDFIRACPWRRIRHAKRKNRSFRRGGGIASSNGGGNAVLERTRNGGSAEAAEVCALCTTFMRNEIGCSLFCGDETVPQIFWIRHSFFMLFVSNPLCSEKLQLKLRHSLDKREECGTMGVR